MENLSVLKAILSASKRIVVTTHHKPDGDAMGSSLGLYHYLVLKGHNVQVITPSDYAYFLHWLPGNGDVTVFPEAEEKSAELIAAADLIFCLDFNHLARINNLGLFVEQSKATKVMIDHHLEPQGFDDFRLWKTQACATAELVVEFIELMGDKYLINKDIATCLYTGIMTDSGSFRFPSTTASLHRKVADLIEAGADNSYIHERVYDTYSESRLRFLGYCVKDKLQVLPAYKTAMISLSKEELKEYQIITGDTEGIVNYALAINGIKLAVFVVERDGIIKLSFRSKSDFPANEIAKKYFEGGGHRNAAGGQSKDSLEDVVKKVKSILPEYQELLNQ